MRDSIHRWLLLTALFGQSALAQTVVRHDEDLASDRPEAWAMNYTVASTFMTAFGDVPALAPGQWDAALEVGAIPRLSDEQQHVGFIGAKQEDLNRSPVFGRLRLRFGLPAAWVAEVGYTPPLEIDGTRPRDVVTLAVGHRVFEGHAWTLSARAFGQHGRAEGDITCPARLAGVSDPQQNRFGCQAPSDDQIALNYYGGDFTAGWGGGATRFHATLGVVRTELAVQVDALVFGARDRTRLVARGVLPYLALGASHPVDAHWSLGVEALYVPLPVKREAGGERTNDPFATVRLQLRYRYE
jgi:hypothetical protein